MASSPAAAGWVGIRNDASGTVALDGAGPTQIAPGMRQVWILEDGLQPAPDSAVRSRKTLWRMDCERRRMGIKAFVSYSEPAGIGAPALNRFNPEDQVRMDDVVPGTFGELIFRLTCGATISTPRAPRVAPL